MAAFRQNRFVWFQLYKLSEETKQPSLAFDPGLPHLTRHGCSNHNDPRELSVLSHKTSDQARFGPVLDVFVEAAIAGARAMQAAGKALLTVKGDGTPHAAADLASDAAIGDVLDRHLPDVPVVSEERSHALPRGFADGRFILVDPLDGTREFLQGHPDHAVCIALIEQRRPVAGVILAPMQRKIWIAGDKATEMDLDGELQPMSTSQKTLMLAAQTEKPLHMVTSRSRPDPLARRFFPEITEQNIRQIGAVMKLVAVAKGEACVFPTSNPSSEWDIAAGEALVLAAGGVMLGLNGKRLVYGRKRLRFIHEPYIAATNMGIARKAIDQWRAC
jgi:3'(2'), 5'-bisphosphate nucleotidase